MSMKIYCQKCNREVVLSVGKWGYEKVMIGDCICGHTIIGRQDFGGKYYYNYEVTKPADLGISVTDGVGTEDIVR
jgi:hypothetical protein